MGWRQAVGLMVALLLAGTGRVLAQEPLYRESHALLFGVTGSGGRTESAPETERFGAVLRSSGWETTVRIDPERERLAESVEKFLGEHGGEERNRLLIYFAGESRTDRRGEPCLLAAPGPQGAESCLEIARIEEWLKGVRSRHLLLILNASLRLKGGRCGERVVAVRPETSRAWVSIVAGVGTPPRGPASTGLCPTRSRDRAASREARHSGADSRGQTPRSERSPGGPPGASPPSRPGVAR